MSIFFNHERTRNLAIYSISRNERLSFVVDVGAGEVHGVSIPTEQGVEIAIAVLDELMPTDDNYNTEAYHIRQARNSLSYIIEERKRAVDLTNFEEDAKKLYNATRLASKRPWEEASNSDRTLFVSLAKTAKEMYGNE